VEIAGDRNQPIEIRDAAKESIDEILHSPRDQRP
jgi:hypothetical protein